jgi:hypothetical protein
MNFLGTLGGIKINERTEVLDRNDRVIPGLYAAGNDAGGLYGIAMTSSPPERAAVLHSTRDAFEERTC